MASTLRTADSVLWELVNLVQPPRGCEIRLTERVAVGVFEPNWTSVIGPIEPLKLALYDQKLAEIRKAHPKLDWSGVTIVAGSRTIARFLSEIES